MKTKMKYESMQHCCTERCCANREHFLQVHFVFPFVVLFQPFIRLSILQARYSLPEDRGKYLMRAFDSVL
jgi:hypothetical protein